MSEPHPITPLERASVERLLTALCEEHGISPQPALEWSRRLRRALGKAYGRRLIRLSAWLDHEQAQATLRHELAHVAAMGLCGTPHGVQWKEWAVRLGADPRATSHTGPSLAPEPSPRRTASGLECPGCGVRIVRFRVLRGLYCRACGPRKGMLKRAVRGPYAAVVAWAKGDR